jgi:hypothetical protein
MNPRSSKIGLVAAVLCVTACVKSYTRPPAGKTVELGGLSAEVHDFGARLCDTDPRLVANELQAVNALLLKYLDGTSAGPEGTWAEEHAVMLEQGGRQLPSALDAYEATVRGTARCRFDAKLGVDDLSRRGEELSRQARARVEETPELLPYAQARAALGKWKAAQPEAQATAKESWCPQKIKRGSPDLYYVLRDEHGTTEFLFCDGSKVSRPEKGKPTYAGPDSKKVAVKPYLDATVGYPDSEIQKAPRLPEPKQPQNAASSEEDPAGDD